ncbi:HAD family hydrolase [Cobetia sp. L2A1]|uniref:HAD family hydrolase n=1 Tax=Cobetia sp. L2A1 TaxID=2686360 RepID=UPI002D80F923|nr:HAD family phosphatase [Cobetia sp. L2A1]
MSSGERRSIHAQSFGAGALADGDTGKPLRQVIFDCDGVLVDSEVLAEQVLTQQLAEWLPDLDAEAELRTALGMTTDAILGHLEAMSAHQLPMQALERIDSAIESRLADELAAIDGVAELLEQLSLQGMAMAIVSNSSARRVKASLAATGLDRWLGSVPLFTAEQVAVPKPAPDVYQLALRRLGRDVSECVVVEDSLAGVTAAVAAGLRVIGFTGAGHIPAGHDVSQREAGAWQSTANMAEVSTMISGLLTDDALAKE